tara:strand:- start:16481 stop:18319 length:1839 start_codon:yes stop_codon:yes gene_type:complete
MEIAHASIEKEFGLSELDNVRLPVDLYRRIGAESHQCIDLDGHHGAHVFDLNYPLKEKFGFTEQFDLVTNHGTTEHLMNQMTAFQNVHDLTSVGGVMLHALPFQGYQNHGMFNYNPSLFLDLSVANGYRVFGLFVSYDDKLYAYDDDFLARNNVSAATDVLIMAVMVKENSAPFEAPYDGRYFAKHGRGDISPLDSVGTTRRFGGQSNEFSILDPDPAGFVETPQKEYQFITPIWGDRFVEDYLAVTLPSQLSKGNLGAFTREEAGYTIVTTSANQQRIMGSEAFAQLSTLLPVTFHIHHGHPGENSYTRMTRAYNLAVSKINKAQTCFFLTGDDFYSDGLFKMARKHIDGGKKAVMVPTIRVGAESFKSVILAKETKTLPSAELVNMMLQHEHPLTTACVVNDKSRRLHRLPAQTLYRLDNGYIGRWNVMHPLAVKVPAKPMQITATVDWNYPALFVGNVGALHVVSDSDEGVIVSPTPISYTQDEEINYRGTRRRRIRNLKEWVDIEWALNFHIRQSEVPVHFHSGPANPEWEAGLRAVDSVWKPFKRYVESRKIPVPPQAEGFGMHLLGRAVRTRPSRRLRPFFRITRRRAIKKLSSAIYRTAARLLPR